MTEPGGPGDTANDPADPVPVQGPSVHVRERLPLPAGHPPVPSAVTEHVPRLAVTRRTVPALAVRGHRLRMRTGVDHKGVRQLGAAFGLHEQPKAGPLVLAKQALEARGRWTEPRAELEALPRAANVATDSTWRAEQKCLIAVARVPKLDLERSSDHRRRVPALRRSGTLRCCRHHRGWARVRRLWPRVVG